MCRLKSYFEFCPISVGVTSHLSCILLFVAFQLGVVKSLSAQSETADASERTPWTASRVKGTPEPPLPLSIEPAFPKLKFNDPMHVRWQPDLRRYFVCELGGKIWSFPHDETIEVADLVVDLKASLKSFDPERVIGCENVYSIVFDPEFASNRFVYVCIILKGKTDKPLSDGSRISRFRVTDENPPKLDISSELPIITWLAGGHNGCDLAFDNSGCLLISTGDATDPSPPDGLATGQDISDLLSSVLRIDVRGATKEMSYKIPPDNPFQKLADAKPEVWAFGFRNPWRISVDRTTGQLWLGDVGWEKWELIHRIDRGGNYGWSVREGHELIQPNAAVGPGPLLPPRVALPHADAASITGGFVYRGQLLNQLVGQYIFGDWITGRVWAVPLDDESKHREIASGQLRIIAFSPDRNDEPLVVNHLASTTLFRLVTNKDYERELTETRNFPRLLSQTGLFTDVGKAITAVGVRQFNINHPQWLDGAQSTHYIALTDSQRVTVYKDPQPVGAVAMFNSRLHYPAGAVLARTIFMPRDNTGNLAAQLCIETQLLHFDGRLWRGYSYIWNEAQTDAELAPASGLELTLPGADGQRWRVHSRTECMQCHNPWPETTLAFTPEQLHQPDRGADSDWLKLVREGFVVTQEKKQKAIDPELCVRQPLVAKNHNDITAAARAYLHVNCSHCHQNGAGAAVNLSLKVTDNLAGLKAVDVAPAKGNFGIEAGKLIASGAAARSALVYRMASSSTGRMPHIGSREVDFEGVVVIADWIDSLKDPKPTQNSNEVSAAAQPTNSPATDTGNKPADESFEARATRLQATFGENTAASNDRNQVVGDSDADRIRSERIRSALGLAIDLARHETESARHRPARQRQTVRPWLLALAHSPDPLISTLFEAHLPVTERQRRLGSGATFADVADITGDAAHGAAWFFDTTRSQCAKCHRVGDRGGQVGPALTHIGKKSSPAQLFEALVDPSRIIEPKYQSHIVLTSDGKIITGLLEEESPKELTLIDAQGTRQTIDVDDIESRSLDTKSLMPSGLAGELTAQQAADLLAYLKSLH